VTSRCSGAYSGYSSASTVSGIVVAPPVGAIGCCSGCFSASPILTVIATVVVTTVAAVVLLHCQVCQLL
jgi:hypothetical protein